MSDEITADEKQFAMFAYVGSLVGFIPPLIILAVKGDSAFVKYHATQAMIMSLVAGLAVGLSFGICLLALPLFWVLQVMWAMKASKGSWDGYPGIAGIGRPPQAVVDASS